MIRSLLKTVLSSPKTKSIVLDTHTSRTTLACQVRHIFANSVNFQQDQGDPVSETAQPVLQIEGLTEEDIAKLTDNDPEKLKKLRLYKFEYEIYREDGSEVPSSMTFTQWKDLLARDSRMGRKRQLRFYFINEMKKKSEQEKKAEIRKKMEEEYANRESLPKDGHIQYGLWNNNIFLKISETKMDRFYTSRLIPALQFAPPLLLDMSYDDHMSTRESSNAANQLAIAFSNNRQHPEPMNLMLVNAKRDGSTMEFLEKRIPILYNPDFPMEVHPESYLDLFPKEKLVYLTPHCKEEMTHFDPDAIYIIGCFVDKGVSEPISLAKAKKEGLKTAKLPLDQYLDFGSGSGKCLTVNQMVCILTELQYTNDWNKALEFVPKRKLKTQEEIAAMVNKFNPLKRDSKYTPKRNSNSEIVTPYPKKTQISGAEKKPRSKAKHSIESLFDRDY
uniref:RNA (guanine-9-)-methyltransferase domain-containing protein 1 n=1 Tax=Lynceus sp. MCZ IZ 141354 TaxID=1930659 RepID=A0A9N6WUE1_9CRUS|nr:EOG090X0D3U [Lynceus sp. MCZ IZ 141354]